MAYFMADFDTWYVIMTPKRLNEIVMTAVQDTGPLQILRYRGAYGQYPDYGIELTGHVRANCPKCTEPKGTRAKQPKKDSGANTSAERLGGG
ncbi:hypothetical protein ABG067_004930 [Albugo candida]